MIIGLASSGLHSNGFSLVREIVEREGLSLTDPAPFDPKGKFGGDLGAALLIPTRIYVKSCLTAIRTGHVKALAHITGGGLIENVPRVLPDGLGAAFYAKSWDVPPVFDWLRRSGNIDLTEMNRTFNCGIGMILIVSPDHAADILRVLQDAGEIAAPIGEVISVTADDPSVALYDLEDAWS